MWYEVEIIYMEKWEKFVLLWVFYFKSNKKVLMWYKKWKKLKMFWNWWFFGRSEKNERGGEMGFQTGP